MEALYTIAAITFLVFVSTEVVAGVILYRNRARFAPVLRRFVRQTIGLDLLESRLQGHDATARENFARLERKINYIGRHVKMEREMLKQAGVIVPDTSANVAGSEKIEPSNIRRLRF